jgi:hypothetical protein
MCRGSILPCWRGEKKVMISMGLERGNKIILNIFRLALPWAYRQLVVVKLEENRWRDWLQVRWVGADKRVGLELESQQVRWNGFLILKRRARLRMLCASMIEWQVALRTVESERVLRFLLTNFIHWEQI